MGPLPTVAREAGQMALARKSQPWSVTVPDFFDPVDRYRRLVAQVLGADVEGVAVTPSVSYGLATAAANLTVAPEHRIVVLADQFPSNVYIWRDLAQRCGARVVTVEVPSDKTPTEALVEAIDDGVDVVASAPAHWTDGRVVDLRAVGAAARAHDAALVVDVCQAAGAVPLDVSEWGAAFVAGATYKWLLGPYSLGFVWVGADHRDGRPLEHNWIARAGSDDFAHLVDYTDEFGAGARRFDMGEVSNFVSIATALASLELVVEQWGVERISAWARRLTDSIADGAADLGLGVVPEGQRSPHLQGLTLAADVDPEAVAVGLAERQVNVSVRGRSVRVSAHVWNDASDVDRLLAALAELVDGSPTVSSSSGGHVR